MKTGIRAFLHLLWRRLVFWVGDIRRLSHFPWLTWDVHEHRVRHEEIMAALPQLRYGDIGLHRDAGYLSNLAIPGFMKRMNLEADQFSNHAVHPPDCHGNLRDRNSVAFSHLVNDIDHTRRPYLNEIDLFLLNWSTTLIYGVAPVFYKQVIM